MTPNEALELLWAAATKPNYRFSTESYEHLCQARRILTDSGLTFGSLRTTNVRRCEEGFGHPLDSWSGAEWGNAAGGEGGESIGAFLALLAMHGLGSAQNIAKKILRFRDGVAGNKKSKEEYLADLASEIAGTLIYLDLWAASQGIDLGKAVRDEFNKKSDEIGSTVKL
ncbi:MAG: hypothetical protein C5B50_00695 [Verrucomicrobia bacterium]|nr:MAG: hypothetical protein C5B50_00695 [Verrucomicrobiota bacterium]